MDGFMAAAALLPPGLRRSAMALDPAERAVCEEIRLRRGQQSTVLMAGREYPLGAGTVTERELRAVAETATGASMHAAGEQLRRGFLAAPGGVRVGVCGTAVTGPMGLESLREISSLALRIPRAVPGCADGIWSALTAGGFASTLIVSPPGAGKTTLLRELIRRLSAAGWRVAVADERGEIADAWQGEPAFDIGPRTDVLTGLEKAQALGILLRGMGPQIAAVDEAADSAEADAVLAAAGCGVAVLATVHGAPEGPESPVLRKMRTSGVFRRQVWVSCTDGVRRYEVEALPCV